jgi:hypothetical protein
MTTPRLTFSSSPSSFWRNTKWLSSPPTAIIWFRTLWLLPISKNETEAERTPGWYHWGDPGRIAESAWHCDRKWLPGSVPKMEETVGPVSTCGREPLRGWWRPIGLMVSFMIFYSASPEYFGFSLTILSKTQACFFVRYDGITLTIRQTQYDTSLENQGRLTKTLGIASVWMSSEQECIRVYRVGKKNESGCSMKEIQLCKLQRMILQSTNATTNSFYQ